MRKANILLTIFSLGYFVVVLSSCASLKETTKCILGTSTRELEEGRKNAITKKINLSASECYNKVLNSINTGSKHYIYAKATNKMIAIYASLDNTAAGIYFNEIDANNTEVQVSSPSTFVKEAIAKEVFAVLPEPVVPAPVEEPPLTAETTPIP